jgi:hypothetical protein
MMKCPCRLMGVFFLVLVLFNNFGYRNIILPESLQAMKMGVKNDNVLLQ